MPDRYLIETKTYFPYKQIPKFKNIGKIEDHWMLKSWDGEGESLDQWKNDPTLEALVESIPTRKEIKDEIKVKEGVISLSVPVKIEVYPGCFVLSEIKEKFLSKYGFLEEIFVKEIVPEMSGCKPLGDKVLVRTEEGTKVGWEFHGCTYGCLGSREIAIIYRGGSAFIGTDEKLVSYE